MLTYRLVLTGLACTALSLSCTTTKKNEGYAALDVEDPDPDNDEDAPKFCNPADKTGEALQTCYRQNEEIYRVFDEEAKKREPWFNFTQDSWVASPELEAQYVLPVVKDSGKQQQAVSKLKSVAFIELTPAEVEGFTGKKASFTDKKPYLVRALLYYRETGNFSVLHKDQAILVQHDSLGKDMPKETRTAVVVFLASAPKQVYVDCTVSDEL